MDAFYNCPYAFLYCLALKKMLSHKLQPIYLEAMCLKNKEL